jgi:hypothetical protein
VVVVDILVVVMVVMVDTVVVVLIMAASWVSPAYLAAAAVDPYECSYGCSLVGPAVEGGDGEIYMNACLATCQVRTMLLLSDARLL